MVDGVVQQVEKQQAAAPERPPQQQPKKTMDVTDPVSAKAKVLDIKVFGDPNAWLLLSKASSEREGWMKSTKALQVDGVGCVVQVSTQQRNADGSYSVAEALQFVPGVKVIEEKDASGIVVSRKLRHQ